MIKCQHIGDNGGHHFRHRRAARHLPMGLSVLTCNRRAFSCCNFRFATRPMMRRTQSINRFSIRATRFNFRERLASRGMQNIPSSFPKRRVTFHGNDINFLCTATAIPPTPARVCCPAAVKQYGVAHNRSSDKMASFANGCAGANERFSWVLEVAGTFKTMQPYHWRTRFILRAA